VARVTVQVNDRPYVLGCEDGGESHLRALAAVVETKVRQIAPSAGAPGEARLILMAALMIADDLRGAREDLAAAEARGRRLEEDLDRLEAKALAALDAAARRLEAMAPE
jgi:cell division protein ZapA